MMKRLAAALLLQVFAIFSLSLTMTAQSISPYINYQGKLTNAQGQALPTADYTLTFNIYTAPTGGDRVWGPQMFDAGTGAGHAATVPVVQGNFNVILGPVDTAGRSILRGLSGTERFLEVTVGAGAPITPRQKVLPAPQAANGNPAGTLLAFAGASVPEGYLAADGAEFDVAAYPALGSAVGSAYCPSKTCAAGKFRVPDLRGRSALGRNPAPSSLSQRNLGDTLGEESHVLSAAELPQHRHSVASALHPAGGWMAGGYLGSNYPLDFGRGGNAIMIDADGTYSTYAGESASFTNMQPSIVINYIIKY